MKPCPSLKSILAEFFPLHRTLASGDHDKTLEERAGLKPPAQCMEALRADCASPLQRTFTN
jgi:hypothetical protein